MKYVFILVLLIIGGAGALMGGVVAFRSGRRSSGCSGPDGPVPRPRLPPWPLL